MTVLVDAVADRAGTAPGSGHRFDRLIVGGTAGLIASVRQALRSGLERLGGSQDSGRSTCQQVRVMRELGLKTSSALVRFAVEAGIAREEISS